VKKWKVGKMGTEKRWVNQKHIAVTNLKNLFIRMRQITKIG
jgi:hypothetical protein